ncbi:MAG: glycoside hydrolase domain-containing protein, partial [bacterium]
MRDMPRAVRMEQPIFYFCRSDDFLYIAMESLASNTNKIVASTTKADNKKIIGDDCLELMIAPGAGEAIEQYDFPVFYHAVNAIGTVWDAKLVPKLNESHKAWSSGIESASTVEGTLWITELKIPFASIRNAPPTDGETWRMNFDRTYFDYNWTAWNAAGSFNRAHTGGDVTFRKNAPVVRLSDTGALLDGGLKLPIELVNPTDSPQSIQATVRVKGRPDTSASWSTLHDKTKRLDLAPGQRKTLNFGDGQRLSPLNQLSIEVVDGDGRDLFSLVRDLRVPAPRMAKRRAPRRPLVYVFPRYLPSQRELAVRVNYSAWAKAVGYVGQTPAASITVRPHTADGDPAAAPVLSGTLTEFANEVGTWRADTESLAEGRYDLSVVVEGPDGETLVEHDDWFEKQHFPWSQPEPADHTFVPSPWEPIEVADGVVKPWGRSYAVAKNGLLRQVTTQNQDVLTKPMHFVVEQNGETRTAELAQPFIFDDKAPAEVRGHAELKSGNVALRIETIGVYDGLIKHNLTLMPTGDGPVQLDRLRVKLELDDKKFRFYSVGADSMGTNILGDVLPDGQGRLYDSFNDTRSVAASPTFASLLWLGDYRWSFCYAADNDKGWALRDDAPGVELHREGDELVMWLNLIDRPIELNGPRQLQFAFQAGPVKPMPDQWRGIQFASFEYGSNTDDAPVTLRQIAGDGFSMYGGTNTLDPGHTQEQIKKSHERIERLSDDGRYTIVGYQRWPGISKGIPAAPVYRSEWGLDRADWEAPTPRRSILERGIYGNDRARSTLMMIEPTPSYVRYLTDAFDRTLKQTDLVGFYDDTGYPVPLFDPELGYGYTDEKGRQIASTGLWLYRERWKRAAEIAARNDKPLYTLDSQHVHAHWMPAYGLIGVWMPCEHGFYNSFPEQDNFEFYGSLERYYAMSPSHAFGQVPIVGMSSPHEAHAEITRDTRSMLMLTMLHDQSLGGFGNRATREVHRLRQARNIFKPWTEDVRFVGYWQKPHPVKADNPDIHVSLWRRPGAALLAIGNVDEATQTTLRIDPGALGLSQSFDAVDPESGEVFDVTDHTVRLRVKRHSVRLLLVGEVDRYDYQPDIAGPAETVGTPIESLSRLIDGDRITEPWQVVHDEGVSGAGVVHGRAFLQSHAYGYAQLRRPLNRDNVVVQCRILSRRGGSDENAPGLSLAWDSGVMVTAAPAFNRASFHYEGPDSESMWGQSVNTKPVDRWYPYAANWVRIQLKSDAVVCSSSIDGQTWVEEATFPRNSAMQQPPAAVILGSGVKGDRRWRANVNPDRFNTRFGRQLSFFDDFKITDGSESH